MQAKIDAAISAVKRGVKAVVIANGYKPDSISKIVHGENIGTLFAPQSFNSTRKMELTDHLPEDSATHMAISARNASRILQNETSEVRSSILNEIAVQLLAQADTILNINQEDVIAAKKGNLSAPLLSRLQLSKSKLQVLADGLRDIGSSSEPLGKVLKKTELSPGLILEQKTAPIGVLMIIFESRPDALPQIAALAIRSGNGLLVKGGTEALRTNKFLYSLIVDAVYKITNGRVPVRINN
jgi:delta-1-pyrroline-5-carboxylate synthetase